MSKIAELSSEYPNIQSVDEIWIVETMFYDAADSYLRFERHVNEVMVDELDFLNGAPFPN